eukprot:4902101-Ditylum_brightwellii.AAC.1
MDADDDEIVLHVLGVTKGEEERKERDVFGRKIRSRKSMDCIFLIQCAAPPLDILLVFWCYSKMKWVVMILTAVFDVMTYPGREFESGAFKPVITSSMYFDEVRC